jgi:ParB-like chromosome segregation protein Spo0J
VPDRGQMEAIVAQLNDAAFGSDSKLRFAWVRFAELREQDVNANVMPTGMFNALVGNLRKNKAIEGVPLCAVREGGTAMEIVSGHHRVRAAMQAGITEGLVLCYYGITRSELIAKQLSHNSIQGNSDPEIVKRLYEAIESLPEKMESFIDPSLWESLPDPTRFEQVDVDLFADAKTVTVLFLPVQAQDFQKALDLLSKDDDVVYLAHRAQFDSFRDAVHEVRKEMEIYAYPTAIAQMAALALERLEQLKEQRQVVVNEEDVNEEVVDVLL